MDPNCKEKLLSLHLGEHPKMLCKKGFVFALFLGGSWPLCGYLLVHPGTILAASSPPELQKLSPTPVETRIAKSLLHIHRESTESRKETAANLPRFRGEAPRTHTIPAKNQLGNSKNPPRTRRTNSTQKQLPNRIFVENFLLKRTPQQKRLEQKWGGGAPPLGGFN